MPALTIRTESWPIAGRFAIARGAKTRADVVVVELRAGSALGRGECVPYARYGETLDGVAAALEALRPELEGAGVDRARLEALLPAGAARNALDCALWDLEAKQSGLPVWRRAGLAAPQPVLTAYTISLDAPATMARGARAARERPLLKLKLGAAGDAERVRAVREAAPAARLLVDANEGWSIRELERMAPILLDAGVELLEQPLPADQDALLESFESPVPLCADESFREQRALEALRARYRLVNVKLDKSGGLSEALASLRAARALGFGVLVGCMLGTSLAMAPALLLAGAADFVDLDGPLLLARDREPGLAFRGSWIEPPQPALWG